MDNPEAMLKKDIKEYDESEFSPCDVKLILLGDSAVGKSKFILLHFHLVITYFFYVIDQLKDSYQMNSKNNNFMYVEYKFYNCS